MACELEEEVTAMVNDALNYMKPRVVSIERYTSKLERVKNQLLTTVPLTARKKCYLMDLFNWTAYLIVCDVRDCLAKWDATHKKLDQLSNQLREWSSISPVIDLGIGLSWVTQIVVLGMMDKGNSLTHGIGLTAACLMWYINATQDTRDDLRLRIATECSQIYQYKKDLHNGIFALRPMVLQLHANNIQVEKVREHMNTWMLLDRRASMMRECEELVAALPSTERGWRSLLSAGERLLDYGGAHSELPREKVSAAAARCALAGHVLCFLAVVRNQLDQISSRQLIAKLGIVVDNLKSEKDTIDAKIKELEKLGEKLCEFQLIGGGEYDGVIADFDRLVVSIAADVSRCSAEIDNTKSVVEAIHDKINAEVNDQAKKAPLAGLGMLFFGGPILLGYGLVKSNQQRAEYMKDLEGLVEIRGELDSLEHRMDDFSIRVREHVGFLSTNGINVCSESLHKF